VVAENLPSLASPTIPPPIGPRASPARCGRPRENGRGMPGFKHWINGKDGSSCRSFRGKTVVGNSGQVAIKSRLPLCSPKHHGARRAIWQGRTQKGGAGGNKRCLAGTINSGAERKPVIGTVPEGEITLDLATQRIPVGNPYACEKPPRQRAPRARRDHHRICTIHDLAPGQHWVLSGRIDDKDQRANPAQIIQNRGPNQRACGPNWARLKFPRGGTRSNRRPPPTRGPYGLLEFNNMASWN